MKRNKQHTPEILELKNAMKNEYRASRADSVKQKKESVSSKTSHWKLSSQKTKRKKDQKGVLEAYVKNGIP